MNQICEVLILADLFEERRGPATVLRRGGAGRGRPEAARRAGLEVVEKLLTTASSRLRTPFDRRGSDQGVVNATALRSAAHPGQCAQHPQAGSAWRPRCSGRQA